MPRYLLYGKVTLSPGSRPIAEQTADQGSKGLAQLPGYQDVVFFLDEERSEYGALSIWESREAAERADSETTPQFQQALAERAQGPIETRVYEIYEHQR
jgi:heme-degrading monooxygenase HmoA